jgi:hypothetical protein
MEKEITFTAKIDIPEGYEAFYNEDTNSVEIRKKDNLPNSWEEFYKNTPVSNREYFINANSNIIRTSNAPRLEYADKNLLPNEETAKAFLALMQLI